MSRLITTIPGVKNLPLPNGWNISDGDEIVVSDAVWKQILDNDRVAANVKDLGTTTDDVTDVPSWGNTQKVAAGIPVLLIPSSASFPPNGSPRPAIVYREM